MASASSGIPDMRFINRQLPITDVARVLELRLDGLRKIHCWYPDRHKHGDRTASVGIRKINNTVKCFGCDSKSMGPIDLVIDVMAMSAADAALWIAARFEVPTIPARARIEEPGRFRSRFGYESGLGLLIKSGLWGKLSEAARVLAPVFTEMPDRESTDREYAFQISYTALCRYSGLCSPNAVKKALDELGEIGLLKFPEAGLGRSPERGAATYIVTPNSDETMELANACAKQMRDEIAAERELRARLKNERIRAFRGKSLRSVSPVLGGERGLKRRPLSPHPYPRSEE